MKFDWLLCREGAEFGCFMLLGLTYFMMVFYWVVGDKICFYNDLFGERWIEAACFVLVAVAAFVLAWFKWDEGREYP